MYKYYTTISRWHHTWKRFFVTVWWSQLCVTSFRNGGKKKEKFRPRWKGEAGGQNISAAYRSNKVSNSTNANDSFLITCLSKMTQAQLEKKSLWTGLNDHQGRINDQESFAAFDWIWRESSNREKYSIRTSINNWPDWNSRSIRIDQNEKFFVSLRLSQVPLEASRCVVLPYLPYITNLIPSHYHLFKHLQNFLQIYPQKKLVKMSYSIFFLPIRTRSPSIPKLIKCL